MESAAAPPTTPSFPVSRNSRVSIPIRAAALVIRSAPKPSPRRAVTARSPVSNVVAGYELVVRPEHYTQVVGSSQLNFFDSGGRRAVSSALAAAGFRFCRRASA